MFDEINAHTDRKYFDAVWDSAKGKSSSFLLRIWYDENGQIKIEAE